MKFLQNIFEKIYSERDAVVNFSIFLGGVAALITYLLKGDIILGVLSFVIIFSLGKLLFKYLQEKLLEKKTMLESISSLEKEFSKSEVEAIDYFLKSGSCFLSLEYINSGKIKTHGFNSLIARGLITFSQLEGVLPVGFFLDEDIYKKFLR